MRFAVVVCALALLFAFTSSLPTSHGMSGDPEFKPTLEDPNKPVIDANADAYDLVGAPVKEPLVAPSNSLSKAQTGNLLSLEESLENTQEPENATESSVAAAVTPQPDPEQDPNTPKDHSQAQPLQETQGTMKVEEKSSVPLSAPVTANPINSSYPVSENKGALAFKESSESVAPPPAMDDKGMDAAGVVGEPVVVTRPEDAHPMEVVTPLLDPFPCDPTRILNVSVPAATMRTGVSVAYLPSEYGCTAWDDISREKASPEISWTNVYEDVIDFSLQMIDLGDNCEYKGPDAGRIHWHVTGIRKSPSVTLPVGASHDTRLLQGGKEEPNQWLEEYYAGPCPPRGTTSCYRFKVLAHRASGTCQCGHQDVLFERSDKPQEWVYNKPKFVEGQKK